MQLARSAKAPESGLGSDSWQPGVNTLKALLAEDFADDSCNLFSSPCAFQALSQSRFVVIFGELSKQSSSFFIWPLV